jgi:hypothetical protein
MQWPGLFFIAWGLYVLGTSLSGPEGYRKNYKHERVEWIIGEKGARIFFCIMGLVIITFGSLVFFTIIDAGDDAIKW